MNNELNISKYLKKSIEAIKETFIRFPLTILLFISLATIIIYRIEVPYEMISNIEEILDRMLAVIVLGIPLSLSINLLFEKFGEKYSCFVKIATYIVEIGLLILYYFIFYKTTDMVPFVRLLLLTITFLISFLFIPYLFKKENFEMYIIKIIIKIITTIFFTVMLALGVTAILFAIKSLLYSDLSQNLITYTWILAGFIFAPINFLYGLPKIYEIFSTDNYNKVLRVLLLYIIMPIISVYTVVLYIYFGKIIATQVWPKGIVSYLVLSYTSVGIATIFLIKPIIDNNKWAKIFTNIFTKVIIPLLVMMFIAIGIRVNDFGFTEARYYIVIIGIWASFAIIYLNFNKGKRNIVLPISLAIIAFLSVVGPWNAFNVSVNSQNKRFYNILEKYDMIQNDVVVNNDRTIDSYDKREISGILRYFKYDHGFNKLKYLPKDFEMDDMKELFGFEEVYYYDKSRDFYNYFREEKEPIVISGYDVIINCNLYGSEEDDVFKKEVLVQDKTLELTIDNKQNVFVSLNGNNIYSYNLNDYINKLNNEHDFNKNNIQEDLILVDNSDNIEVMYLLNSANGNIENDIIDIDHINVDIFINILP